ncbi:MULTISPECIES: hypothetical protein [unclassified Thiocapsa]|uniref:PKD domain-containing protein n=1 Tax=unclassified Thiocapsa TaxID=2641286 RepID=UPI0035B1E1FB
MTRASSYDAGYIQISVFDGTAWSDWQPLGGTITGVSEVWSFWRDDDELPRYAGQLVKIAWFHTASYPYESTGWYIDDIEIDAATGPQQPPEAQISGAPLQVSPGDLVALSGSGSSDPDGQIASYAWSTMGSCGIAGAANGVDASVQIDADAAEGSQCKVPLEVTDDLGASDSDEAVMTVDCPTEFLLASAQPAPASQLGTLRFA